MTALTEPEQVDVDSLDSAFLEVDVNDEDWSLGNYQILEEIGRGGMGVIYRARQRHSHRVVALKRVLSYHGDSRDTLERFRREAEAAASLDHPNILPIYEVGEANGLPFFTMKYASGGSLFTAARALRGLSRECVRLIAKVARAVDYAHRHGILHRDLKPGNILLDGQGEPMVSDFGLAKWMDANTALTRSLAIFGTPGFIAPEQAEGPSGNVGPAADIYSLGAVLFDLLAGRPPFVGEHALAVIRQAADATAPRLRSLAPNEDRDLETICAKCLERDPQSRYRSAADLADDLERWLQGSPIVARPVSIPARAWRWSKRNPLLASVAALCLLLGAVAATRQIHGWQLEQQLDAQAAALHSVELLPLLDLGQARAAEAFSNEFGQELAASLKSIGPSTLHMKAANLAQPANTQPVAARALLTGTVRSSEGRLRISLHLVEPTSRAALWHKLIEVDAASGSGDAARAVAADVYHALSAADLKSAALQTSDPGLLDPEAKRFIEQGIELANRRGTLDLERSISCLRRAIELQPSSAAAHAALAKTVAFDASTARGIAALAAGLEHARKAVELDPASSEAHLALAALLHHYGKMNESIEQTLIALEFTPTSRRPAMLLANTFTKIGRPDLALAWIAVAEESAPSTGGRDMARADCFAYLGDDSRAEDAYTRYRKLHPEHPEGWMGICRLRLLNGRFDEARAIYQAETKGYADFAFASQMAAQVEFFARNFSEASKLYGRLYEQDPTGGGAFYGAVTYASALGRIWMESDPPKGRELLERCLQIERDALASGTEHPAPLYRLAAIEASLGRTDDALTHLQAAAEAGWVDFRSLRSDPRFDSVNRDPRFTELVERLAEKTTALRKAASL